MKNILITGGAGFIGCHAAKKLAEAGNNIIIIDDFNDYYDSGFKRERVKALLNGKEVKIYEHDITDYFELEKIFKKEKIDQICHLGARAGVRYSIINPFIYEKVNILGTLNLLELARIYNVSHFVAASSSSVYGNNKKVPFNENDDVNEPVSPYAATKRAMELLIYNYHHLYNLKTTCLRFFTVYGPWGRPDMAYFKFAEALMNNEEIDIFNKGEMKRDFTYIDDIIQGITAALNKKFDFEIINLGNNKPVDLLYFIEVLEKNMGKSAKKKYSNMQAGDVKETYADIEKAKRLLNFEPKTNIEDGLKKFVDWFKDWKKV